MRAKTSHYNGTGKPPKKKPPPKKKTAPKKKKPYTGKTRYA